MQKLTQKLEQKQVLQPRQILQAAILQLNIANLEERILDELETNPALEQVEADNEADTEENEETDMDWELEDEYEPPDTFEKKEVKDLPIPQKKDFVEYLLDQLNSYNLNLLERSIAEEIIYNLDESGYLAIDLELISDRFDVGADQVLNVLKKIQGLEPRGIAARNLQECLLLQVDPGVHPRAHTLLSHFFDDVINHRYDQLSAKSGLAEHELQHALEVISHLNPKPGAGHEGMETQTVIPELLVNERDGQWVIVVNDGWLPDVQINQEYVEMLTGALDKKTRTFIKGKVDNAEWFVDALDERRKTLAKVMSAIIKKQPEFFRGNTENLVPMKLQDIADELGMDISTISRSTRGKYVDTPYGIFELKFFFTEGMKTSAGEEISTLEIKRMLKEMLDEENKHNPLTDEQLKEKLNDKGFPLARRTVAKYREQLNIPVARFRKQI